MIRNQLKRYITTLSVGAMLVAGAGPAMAEAVSCRVSIIELGNTTCETDPITPNASAHFLHVSVVGANARWDVRDVVTNTFVVAGQTSGLGMERTIFGLHAPSRYRGTLSSLAPARITLSNT